MVCCNPLGVGGHRRRSAPAVFGLTVLLGLLGAIAACDYKPFYDEPAGRRTADLPPPAGLEGEFERPSTPLPPRAEPLIVPGTDTTIRQRPGPPATLGAPRQGEVTLNFVDADLREVLRAILGDILGANYVVDPKVQGTVTFRTSTPMPISGLMPAVENMLSVNGAAMIASGNAFKIVPAEQITRSGGPVQVRSGGARRDPQSGVVIVPLRYASAEQIRTLLEPFAPPGGTVSADPDRNALLLGGAGAELASMVDIAETFDVDILAGKSFGLFPVQTTNAVTMVENLEQVFGGQDEGPLSGIIRVVPIERLNAVLVIAARASYLDKVKTWIAHLDSGEEEMQQIFVYYAKNSRAADLSAVLSEIFPAGEASRRSTLAPGLLPTQVRSSRLNRPSAPQSAGEIRLTALSDGEEDLRVGQVQSEPLTSQQRRPGQETQQRQQQDGGTGALRRQTSRARLDGGGAETLDVGPYGEVRIVADEVKNAVVVYAKPRAYRLIEQAMRKLDNVPLQVLIEATILEVVLNDTLRYGVEWFFHEGDFGFTSQTRGTLGLTPGAISGLSGFTGVFASSNARVVINALQEVTDVNVVSSPQVFVLDNQTASINVGDQVPISTRTSQSVISADAPIVSSVEYVDTGVILTVTPRVNDGGLVNMDIVQDVSDAVPNTTSQIDSPTIRQRRIESSVAVQHGETVALGGLIRDNRTQGSSGIPFLSRIPILGALFGVQRNEAVRTELLVLITPRVVPNAVEARRVTDELRQRVRRVLTLEDRIQ